MSSKKLPEFKAKSDSDSISTSANEWLLQFNKHFAVHFLEICRELPTDADERFFQSATIQAVIQCLSDAGVAPSVIFEELGQAFVSTNSDFNEWTPELNKRRFELIDKEIQGTIKSNEKVELAGLTRNLRSFIDSEAKNPMEGAKALHKKLLAMEFREKPR